MNYFATCPVGLELACQGELIKHGVEKNILSRGGVSFECDDLTISKVFLDLKIASRILYKIHEFEVRSFEDVYKHAHDFPWHRLFTEKNTVKIKTLVSHESLKENPDWKNSFLFNQKFKDGYVDRFREEKGQRPYVDKQFADVVLHLYIDKNRAIVYFDLCGHPLSHRGYRDEGFSAPLRENLAAGIVNLMGIDFKQEHFIEGMCGSGTVVIEALYKALQIPATFLHWRNLELNRNIWNFQRIPAFKERFALKLDKESVVERIKSSKLNIWAMDIDKKALALTRENLERCGLENLVTINRQDITEFKPKTSNNVLFVNPPYAKRLGEEEELVETYYELGENLKKNFTGSRAYILAGNLPLLKKISLRTSKKIILFNGPIECRLAEYKLF